MAKKKVARTKRAENGRSSRRAAAEVGAVPSMARMASDGARPKTVSIEVLLQPRGEAMDPIDSPETIRFSNVASFRPAKATQDQAAQRLTNLGFRVIAASPYSLSLEGTPELFEKTFGTELEMRTVERVQGGPPMAPTTFMAPTETATWRPPRELAEVVHRAYIQPPAIYFETALPPAVDYFHLAVPNDVSMLTGATEVHHRGITGRGIKVVMIDTGFFNHRFYKRNGYRATVMLGPGAANVSDDEVGHGTAEAANAFAIAPDITFTMIKSGDNSTAAFKAAVALQPDIITCSWGYDLVEPGNSRRKHCLSVPDELKPLELEVARAVAEGIIVVFSAGNGHVSFPGMHPDVLSIGGVYVDAQENMRASDYASAFDSKPYPGRHVPDLCGLVGMQPEAIYIMLPLQPGCEIDRELAGSIFHKGDRTKANDGWSVISGTSAAAPQLAGVCALLKQKKPTLTPQEAKQVLMATARDCTTGVANSASNEGKPLPATPGTDGATGHGLVDAAAAIEML